MQWKESMNTGIREIWIQILSLQLDSYLALGKLLNFSELPQILLCAMIIQESQTQKASFTLLTYYILALQN